jgi:LacI family transcriptional regulator
LKKITSKEIARLAGVSVSTVSIVLNNKPGVGSETRQRVLAILSEYEISSKSSPRESERKVIRFCKIVKHGQIINDRHNVFISEYIDGVVEEAKGFNYSIEFSTYDCLPIAEVIEDLSRLPDVSGCILLATELSFEDVELFQTLAIPHVFLDALYQFGTGSFVTMDNYHMVLLALRYFKDCGHTSIGMLNALGCSNFESRRVAFEQSLGILGLAFNNNSVITLRSTHMGSYEDMKEMLAKRGILDFPTAFFACNDMVALGAIRAFNEAGLQVPEDVSVIGFDNLPSSSLVNPALTSLNVPKISIGHLSVRILMEQLSQKGLSRPLKCMVGGSLVLRSSVLDLNSQK